MNGFAHHLATRAGGCRGEKSASQIVRYIGKYLFFLDSATIDEGRLLETRTLLPYLETCKQVGIGILHRILAHKLAINYMQVEVSWILSGVKCDT